MIHTPGRLAVSLAGILLAVVLMFSQAGFRNAMFDSQAEIIHRLDGDLFILNKLKHIMYDPQAVRQPAALPGRGRPRRPGGLSALHREYGLDLEEPRRSQAAPASGSWRFNPDDHVFDFPEVAAYSDALKMPDTVLFDEKSRDYYGKPQAGTQTELADRAGHGGGDVSPGNRFLARTAT